MTPQERFDNQYITASEICTKLGIISVQLYRMVDNGTFPPVIRIGGGNNRLPGLWERATAEPRIVELLLKE